MNPLIELLNYVRELIEGLEELIQTVRSNRMFSICWVAFIFVLGLAATVFFYVLEKFKNMPDLVKLGPTLLTSAISSFQIKVITVARERILYYEFLKHRMENCADLPQSKIEELIAEAIEALKDLRKRD